MSQLKKLDNDFEKARQSHLTIQRDFIKKMQSLQIINFEEHRK